MEHLGPVIEEDGGDKGLAGFLLLFSIMALKPPMVSPSSPCMEPLRSRMKTSSVKFFFIRNPPILFCLVYKHSIGEFLFGRVARRATNPAAPSGIKQSDLSAGLFQEPEQIPGLEPHGGSVVVGVDPDQAGALQK